VDVDIMDSTEIPGLRFPAGPGPTLADVEACLTTITTSADVVAACLACAWLPGPVSKPPAREAITRLAGALGTQLTWPPADTQATAP
jgi:arginase